MAEASPNYEKLNPKDSREKNTSLQTQQVIITNALFINYQQQESHCMKLKSDVWEIVNKIFLELAKTKCSSSFDSSSEIQEYSFLVSFNMYFIHVIPIDLILFSSPSFCPLRLPFQCKIARLSSSNLKTLEVIICYEFCELRFFGI